MATSNQEISVAPDSAVVAEAPAETMPAETHNQSSTITQLLGSSELLRQILIIICLAICLTLAITLVFWAKEPEMRPLGVMQTEELIQTLDFLDQAKIPYKIEGNTVLVNNEQYQDIKIKLRRGGVTGSSLEGEEILLNDMGFGVSQRLETERLKLSRERQLARAIEQMHSVNKAQVLLAIPKANVFARQAEKPSASVVLTLRSSITVDQEEVDAIVDMVATAVQGMSPARVTVTDQHGRLLNSGSQNPLVSRSHHEFETEQKHEAEYISKIDAILIPVVGVGNYTAEVDVSLDFTTIERTQKTYEPDNTSIRSEFIIEDYQNGKKPIGIPGALSNQPPGAAEIPEEAANANASETRLNANERREQTRNYELDTTISHTQQQTGVLRRLSVSVALDYVASKVEGETPQPRSAEELASITRLLEGGLGFEQARGDTLEVVSIPFTRPVLDSTEDLPIWEQAWFWRAVRTVGSVVVLIVLILAVVRPMLKRIITKDTDFEEDEMAAALSAYEDDQDIDLAPQEEPDSDFGIHQGQLRLPELHKDEDLLKAVRALVENEPDLAAMVVRDWVQADGK